MKRLGKLALALCVIAGTCSIALADGMIFEPTEVGGNKTEIKPPATIETPQAPKAAEPVVGNQNLENALLQLDDGQVKMRNKLMVLKEDYGNVDTKYVDYKQQRADLKKQIRKEEKRIKKLESVKNTIKKQMEEVEKI